MCNKNVSMMVIYIISKYYLIYYIYYEINNNKIGIICIPYAKKISSCIHQNEEWRKTLGQCMAIVEGLSAGVVVGGNTGRETVKIHLLLAATSVSHEGWWRLLFRIFRSRSRGTKEAGGGFYHRWRSKKIDTTPWL